MKRHVASLRSICETFPGPDGKPRPAYCICGKQISDPIHFKTVELDALSKAQRAEAFL